MDPKEREYMIEALKALAPALAPGLPLAELHARIARLSDAQLLYVAGRLSGVGQELIAMLGLR